MKIILSILIVVLISTGMSYSQVNKENKWIGLFDSTYYTGYNKKKPFRNVWMMYSKSTNVLDFQPLSYGLDAVIAMYEATHNLKYLDDAVIFVNNVINSAKPLRNITYSKSSFSDNYATWVVTDSSKQYASLNMKETSLSEAYFFQYVTHLLYIIKNTQSLIQLKSYRDFYTTTLAFTEKNIWEKWYSRGYKLGGKTIFEGRTHMESHWAYMACILSKITTDSGKKAEYIDAYTTYNALLKSNFKTRSDMPGVYIWNSTWDSKTSRDQTFVQDVSHGNLVVSYIVEAHDLSVFWTTTDINNLCNLVKKYLWINNKFTFKDNLDGSTKLQTTSRGGFQSDGWVKLGRYDRTLQSIYEKYVAYNSTNYYVTDGQLFANLALNEQLLQQKRR